MDRKEKMSKMYNYCDGKHCSNCKVDKENPNHECGDGKGYSMDYNMVSNEELDMNYKIAFGEEENKMLDIKGKQIAVLCDTREKINKFYGALNKKFNVAVFDCENPSKLYIGYDMSDDLKWDSQNYFQNKNYKLITFEEFIGEIKEEEKKVNKFKVGDVVEIIGNCNEHCFEIGDIVELYEKSSDGDFRGRKEGDSRDWGNWIRQEEMELIKENKSSTKSLTITTSDSTTTLSDGTHTVSVNRYYTDKHDEEIAVSEVIDKYYEELARIEREKNTPKVGDKVRVVDSNDVYPNYKDWLIENNVPIRTALKWEDDNKRFIQKEYKVVAIHPHREGSKRILALIEGEYESFIIGIEGLKVD